MICSAGLKYDPESLWLERRLRDHPCNMKRTPADLAMEKLWRDRRIAILYAKRVLRANKRLAKAVNENRDEALVWWRNCKDRTVSVERERERAKLWKERALRAGWKPEAAEGQEVRP
jgi:predicted GIY-YIG superfamily endonuclease